MEKKNYLRGNGFPFLQVENLPTQFTVIGAKTQHD
jgi:hypothetical protein